MTHTTHAGYGQDFGAGRRRIMTGQVMGGSTAVQLHELLLESEDISGFLQELAVATAQDLTAHRAEMSCAVVLLRPKRPVTVTASNPDAAQLDEVQCHQGDGPCLTAARENREVYVADTRTDPRWPAYGRAAVDAGVLSVLGVPLDLRGEAAAALDVYADRPGAFDEATVEIIRAHAVALSTTLRLAVRLARHRDTEVDLKAAMASRRDIDLAVGILMGQHHCSQDQAFGMLRAASSHRNVKLRDLAAEVAQRVGRGPTTTHFED
jgi:GAF domain-containing protein